MLAAAELIVWFVVCSSMTEYCEAETWIIDQTV